jgi:transglutaminase-like putative cysteine protease
MGVALVGIIALAAVGFFGARLLLAQRPQQEPVAAIRSEKESAPPQTDARETPPAKSEPSHFPTPSEVETLPEEDTGSPTPRRTKPTATGPTPMPEPILPKPRAPASPPKQADPSRAKPPALREEWDDETPKKRAPKRPRDDADPKPATRVADDSKRYAAIDEHALQAPAEAEQSIAALAAYLVKPAKNDREKVRAIYRWITDRIAYNAPAFLAHRDPGDCSAAAVLKSRLTVCEGYTNLFVALCKEANVKAVKIQGHGKGYGYVAGESLQENHAWNALRLDGGWALLDATWGAGAIGSDRNWSKRFSDFFFLTPPDQLIYSHFPNESKWQLLEPTVAADAYRRWPRVDPILFQYGVMGSQVREKLESPGFREFVQIYAPKGPIHLHKAPIEKRLKAGQEYEFEIEAPTCVKLAALSNGQWHHFTKRGNVWYAKIMPPVGQLRISGQFPDDNKQYWGILAYVAEPAAP